jgi:hypothetical protein
MCNIEDYLDENNKELVSFIRAKNVLINFVPHGEDCYAQQSQKGGNGIITGATIYYYNKEPLSQAKIAHELLHVKADIMLGDNTIMVQIARESPILSCIFREDFCVHILNVTQHIAMAPYLEDMGWFPNDYFETEDLKGLESEFKDFMKNGLKEGKLKNLKNISNYLNYLFTFMFFPGNKFKSELIQLKKVDYVLFHRVKELYKAFNDISLEEDNTDFIQTEYRRFIEGVKNWIDDNKIELPLFPH